MSNKEPINNESKIVALILGNGFDIANNFKTSYSDFVESDEFQSLLSNGNTLAEHIFSVKQLFNWVDVEIEIGNYSFSLEDMTPKEKQRTITAQLLSEYNQLKTAMYQYINSMRTNFVNPKMDKLIDDWLNLTLPNHNTKLFVVNFNYNRWDHIRFFNHAIRDNLLLGEPLHIHGKTDYLVSESRNIVLGVDYGSVRGKSHNFIVKAFDNATCDKAYFNNIHKASKFIIFGCSIGSTDTRYFKPIFEKSRDKDFEIYGYGEIGLSDIQSNIAQLCNYDEFKAGNNVRLLDSSIFS